MTMQIINCQQGTPEWFAARLGIPTASKFQTIITKKGRGGRETYMKKLAAEIVTGEIVEGYKNDNMERGHVMEVDARNLYAFENDVEPVLVGFIRDGEKGCSPDALVGDDGAAEFKSNEPHILLERHEDGGFPEEHKAQCQGVLWIAKREWIDLNCYWPNLKPFTIRAYRDEHYIKNMAQEIDLFNEEKAEMVERYMRYSARVAA